MPQPQPSFTEKLFKPFMDYLGLNGAAALTAAHQQQQSTTQQSQSKTPPIREDQLRKQGWSEKDIAWYRETQKIGR